uniref:Histone acetyl transferase HAT1 N-terminus, putative n=1 Tax=Theileria annulata TaxID=5874 RepID=A0A3B0MYH9_THEAN
MEKFTVMFHPCENLDNYLKNTYSFSPYYTHHFFNNDLNTSAIQWVRYDVYYIVDTYELFIKVSGQLYMSKEDSDIRKSLYTVYNSIYSKIPEYTLILDEPTFKHLLYIRSVGTQKFIPPGRIIAEIPLDNSLIFQLRYCVFQEESNTPNNSPNGSANQKSYYKRLSSEDSYIPEMTDKSIYFKNTLDKDYFDSDLYDECYINISHKGNFDNCLIYDIIKFINKSSSDKHKNTRKSTYDRLDFSVQENFNILHRRLEWFYHWFIEGASNIKPDSRWSVFIPLIILTYDSYDHEYKTTTNSISNLLTSNEEFEKCILNRSSDLNSQSIRLKIVQQPIGTISDMVHFKNKRTHLSKKLKQTASQYNVSIIGMVTAYYFFTLNHDRLRISQFMIFPNYWGKGFGLWVLEFIYRMAIMDSNVREITVEDPTSAFLILRYVVALKICFESKLIDPKILYGNNKSGFGILKLFSKESTIPSKDKISSVCKESKACSSKLVEILQLASILPYPISSQKLVNQYTNKRQKINDIDVKLSLFIQSDTYMDYCDKLKNKIKFEEIKGNGNTKNIKKLSPDKYLNSVCL